MKTFRDLKDVTEGVTGATLAEEAGSFKKGDYVVIVQCLNGQGLIRVRKFASDHAENISQDTKIE